MTLLTFFMTTIMVVSWSILCSSNPMNMSLLVMMMATLVSAIISLTTSSWYSLILFLIYVGGMMIMFSYFVSLSSNDPMMLKSKLHLIIFPMIIAKSLNLQIVTPTMNSPQTMKLLNHSNVMMLLLITIILLMVMIIAIKVVKKNNGPLRGFNTY